MGLKPPTRDILFDTVSQTPLPACGLAFVVNHLAHSCASRAVLHMIFVQLNIDNR